MRSHARWTKSRPWWANNLCFVVTIGERIFFIGFMLLVAMMNKRAGGLLWHSMWRKIIFACILVAVQLVLIALLQHTKQKAGYASTTNGEAAARSLVGVDTTTGEPVARSVTGAGVQCNAIVPFTTSDAKDCDNTNEHNICEASASVTLAE